MNQGRRHTIDPQKKRNRRWVVIALMAMFGPVELGCATHSNRLMGPRQAFYANDFPTAKEGLEKLVERPKGDASVVELDLALLELFEGNLEGAELRLREVRDKWDHAEQLSVGEETLALISDDQAKQYAGEDYEKLLVRVLLTLTSLIGDGIDAESYSLQTLDKQSDLLDLAKEHLDPDLAPTYCLPAVAPYLRGMLKESTLRDYDDALRSYHDALAIEPDALFIQDDIARAEGGVHSSPGHGVVYVVALVGKGPVKREVKHKVTQDALLVADQILSSKSEYRVPPTLAPVKVAEIVSPPKPFDLLGVKVDGTPVSTTLPLTDLHKLASEAYAVKLPRVIAKTVVRRVIKKGAVYAAKDHFEANSSLASLALDAAGVMWEASESADTRCWGLLPREIQVLRLELPAGSHTLNLEPVTGGLPIAPGRPCVVDVRDGQNSYVLSYWPGTQPIGKILVSE